MGRARLFAATLLLALFAVCGGPNATRAQGAMPAPPAKPAAVAPGKVKALIRTLENDAERSKLIEQLRTLQAAEAQDAERAARQENLGRRLLDYVASRINGLSRKLVDGSRALTDIPKAYRSIAAQARNPEMRARWLSVLWKLLIALAAGFVAEWAVRRALQSPRRALETRPVETLWTRAPTLFGRTLLDVVPVFAFLGASHGVMNAVDAGDAVRAAILTMINANVLARLTLVVGRLALAPRTPSLRLAPLSDQDAGYLYIWLRRLVEAPIYAFFTIEALRILGISAAAADGLSQLVGLLVTLMGVIFILQNRTTVAGWLRGEGGLAAGRMLRARVADIWHVLAVLYIVGVYAVWSLEIEDGFAYVMRATLLTIVIVAFARVLAAALQRAARRLFALNGEMRSRFPGLEGRANRYLPILERAAAAVIFVVAGFAVLESWGINSFDWIGTPFGRRLTGGILTVVLIVVAAVLLWEMTDAAITRHLTRDGDSGGAVGPRARTLLPLLRTIMLVTLVAMVVLVALSELGINIGPLLAGAGVVGLAIGFGSQTLVKDIITGMFILMEDQIAVGDVVKIGSHAGVVEHLTLRTLRLRDLAGTVHIVPFSEVTTVENMTKEFSRYVFDVGVAYREDTDEVVAVLRALGDELMQDETYRDDILQPLEILGVDSFGDNAVVIKARITTKPIRQWAVGREFNRRMKRRFDELGIEIPFPHRTIYFGEDKSGDAPPARIARARQRTKPDAADAPQAKATDAAALPTPDTGGIAPPDGD